MTKCAEYEGIAETFLAGHQVATAVTTSTRPEAPQTQHVPHLERALVNNLARSQSGAPATDVEHEQGGQAFAVDLRGLSGSTELDAARNSELQRMIPKLSYAVCPQQLGINVDVERKVIKNSMSDIERNIFRNFYSGDQIKINQATREANKLVHMSSDLRDKMIASFTIGSAQDHEAARDVLVAYDLLLGPYTGTHADDLVKVSDATFALMAQQLKAIELKLANVRLLDSLQGAQRLASALSLAMTDSSTSAVLVLVGPSRNGKNNFINAMIGRVVVLPDLAWDCMLPTMIKAGGATASRYSLDIVGKCENATLEQVEGKALQIFHGRVFELAQSRQGDSRFLTLQRSVALQDALSGAGCWTEDIIFEWVSALQSAAAFFTEGTDMRMLHRLEIVVTIPGVVMPCAILDLPWSLELAREQGRLQRLCFDALPHQCPRVCLALHVLDVDDLSSNRHLHEITHIFDIRKGRRSSVPMCVVINAITPLQVKDVESKLSASRMLLHALTCQGSLSRPLVISTDIYLAWRLVDTLPQNKMPDASDFGAYRNEIRHILKVSDVGRELLLSASGQDCYGSLGPDDLDRLSRFSWRLVPNAVDYKTLCHAFCVALCKWPRLVAQEFYHDLLTRVSAEFSQMSDRIWQSTAGCAGSQADARVFEIASNDECLKMCCQVVYKVRGQSALQRSIAAAEQIGNPGNFSAFQPNRDMVEGATDEDVAAAYERYVSGHWSLASKWLDALGFAENGMKYHAALGFVGAFADWCCRQAAQCFEHGQDDEIVEAFVLSMAEDPMGADVHRCIMQHFLKTLAAVKEQQVQRFCMHEPLNFTLPDSTVTPSDDLSHMEAAVFRGLPDTGDAETFTSEQTDSESTYRIGRELTVQYFRDIGRKAVEVTSTYHKRFMLEDVKLLLGRQVEQAKARVCSLQEIQSLLESTHDAMQYVKYCAAQHA